MFMQIAADLGTALEVLMRNGHWNSTRLTETVDMILCLKIGGGF